MSNIADLPIGEQVRRWRAESDMSGAALAGLLGISRGKVSELESGQFLPGVKVALAIEALSGGRIDAGALNEDVKAARHAVLDSSALAAVSPGKMAGNSRLATQGDGRAEGPQGHAPAPQVPGAQRRSSAEDAAAEAVAQTGGL